MKITKSSENIKIKGYKGTWYVIDMSYYWGNKVFLLESEQYGDEVSAIIVSESGKVVLADVWNGWNDLMEAAQSGMVIL